MIEEFEYELMCATFSMIPISNKEPNEVPEEVCTKILKFITKITDPPEYGDDGMDEQVGTLNCWLVYEFLTFIGCVNDSKERIEVVCVHLQFILEADNAGRRYLALLLIDVLFGCFRYFRVYFLDTYWKDFLERCVNVFKPNPETWQRLYPLGVAHILKSTAVGIVKAWCQKRGGDHPILLDCIQYMKEKLHVITLKLYKDEEMIVETYQPLVIELEEDYMPDVSDLIDFVLGEGNLDIEIENSNELDGNLQEEECS